MKLLTIAVPAYNSQDYLERCLESLVPGGEDVEIIVINDGSTDRTLEIAESYQEKYPGIVRVVSQENGGHGEAVNTGLKNATGLFFKVVDSDDRLARVAYSRVLGTLKKIASDGAELDMMICNYVYDKQDTTHKKVMRYRHAMPTDRIITWEEGFRMKKTQFLLMHSVIYRTGLLRECGIVLPKHTFYVDNLYLVQPISCVKTLYYLDVDLYMYFIGRDDQSVSEKVMIKRIDQQILVTKMIIDCNEGRTFEHANQRRFMYKYLDMMMCVTSIMLLIDGSSEALAKKENVWSYLKEKDIRLYRRMRCGLLGVTMNFPGEFGRKLSIFLYRLTDKIYGFN